jgi:hypothetical protein
MTSGEAVGTAAVGCSRSNTETVSVVRAALAAFALGEEWGCTAWVCSEDSVAVEWAAQAEGGCCDGLRCGRWWRFLCRRRRNCGRCCRRREKLCPGRILLLLVQQGCELADVRLEELELVLGRLARCDHLHDGLELRVHARPLRQHMDNRVWRWGACGPWRRRRRLLYGLRRRRSWLGLLLLVDGLAVGVVLGVLVRLAVLRLVVVRP